MSIDSRGNNLYRKRTILLDGRQKESLKVETEWTGENKEIKA